MGDHQSFFNFLRMPAEMFDELLNRVGPRCRKTNTIYRKALKLALTLRHWASVDKYPTLYEFRVARNSFDIYFGSVPENDDFDRFRL